MITYNSDDMVLALNDAPVDPRTGNKVVYNASWIANTDSMIGERNEDWVRRELDWFNDHGEHDHRSCVVLAAHHHPRSHQHTGIDQRDYRVFLNHSHCTPH